MIEPNDRQPPKSVMNTAGLLRVLSNELCAAILDELWTARKVPEYVKICNNLTLIGRLDNVLPLTAQPDAKP